MRILAILSLPFTACTKEQTGPESLGYAIGGETSGTITAPDSSIIALEWQLPSDSETTEIAFYTHVQHEGRWISDYENYMVRDVHSRPMRSTVQDTLSLCWVRLNKNNATISAGAVPDTGGILRFQLAYKESLVEDGIALVCDISNPKKQVTLGFGLASIRLNGPYEDGEFAWSDTYFGEFDQRATRVLFVYPPSVIDEPAPIE